MQCYISWFTLKQMPFFTFSITLFLPEAAAEDVGGGGGGGVGGGGGGGGGGGQGRGSPWKIIKLNKSVYIESGTYQFC